MRDKAMDWLQDLYRFEETRPERMKGRIRSGWVLGLALNLIYYVIFFRQDIYLANITALPTETALAISIAHLPFSIYYLIQAYFIFKHKEQLPRQRFPAIATVLFQGIAVICAIVLWFSIANNR